MARLFWHLKRICLWLQIRHKTSYRLTCVAFVLVRDRLSLLKRCKGLFHGELQLFCLQLRAPPATVTAWKRSTYHKWSRIIVTARPRFKLPSICRQDTIVTLVHKAAVALNRRWDKLNFSAAQFAN